MTIKTTYGLKVPHANRHPEEYEWVNLDTQERRPATQSVPLSSAWRLQRKGFFASEDVGTVLRLLRA